MSGFDESQYGKGLRPRDWASYPLGTVSWAPRMAAQAAFKLVPRDEWKDRIAAKTEEKSWLWDLMQAAGMQRKNQRNYSWCHSFSVTGAAEVAIVASGKPYVKLSPSSIAGPITNWNSGRGMPILDPLRHAQHHGIAEEVFIPELTDDRRKLTPEAIDNARSHKVRGYDVDAKAWDEIVTCALLNIPTCWGVYHDWGHAIYGGVKLLYVNGVLHSQYVNSWGDGYTDGTNCGPGCGLVREGGPHYPEEAFAILAAN